MSVVYKGLDTALDREVAVKVLHPHLAGKEESRKRLAREAKAVARLRHPNILEVFDYAGAESTEAYIVTEYIRGQTLRQFVSTEALQPPEIAAMVVHEIAAALGHAHELGVIHRDLKPENVMLRDDGCLKLMDFGIAKILDRDEKMTMTGALVGSPAHMAPEIIEGEEAGAEADIFSLGTMLYLFATGNLPFTASNTTATLRRILDGLYDDPRQVVATVSDELAEIISKCLRRNPADRYPNAGKLRDALTEYLAGLGLSRVSDELKQFFADPQSYRKALVPRLTSALLVNSERLIAEKRSARALSSLNLVLAHDPGNERTQMLLSQMRSRNSRRTRLVTTARLAFAAGALFIISMGTWRGVLAARRVDDYRPPFILHPADVPVADGIYPQAPAPKLVAEPAQQLEKLEPRLTAPPSLGTTRKLEVSRAPIEAAGSLLEVTINVRPWGFLTVDKKDKQPDAQALHRLRLLPGHHSFTVTCEVCDTNGKTIDFEVAAGRDNAVSIAAPLKPSMLQFAGYPDGAVARVGSETRLTAETPEKPFLVKMPPEGSPEMLHRVQYEVLLGGEPIDQGVKAVVPGKAEVVRAKGAP